MSRPLEDFESEIAERFLRGGFWLCSPKAEWVRGYLLKHGRGYPYAMWKAWREFAAHIGLRPGSYISFVRYLYVLRRLGLIREAGTEQAVPGRIPRRYYELEPSAADSPLWRRPVQTLYPSSDWTLRRGELRERYR